MTTYLAAHVAATRAEDKIADSARASVAAAKSALAAAADGICSAAVAAWKLAGGCARCNGTGSMLTWSTLDGASYDEHGTCDACNGSGGTAGAHPTHPFRPSSGGSYRIPAETSARALDPEKIAALEAQVDLAQEALEAQVAATSIGKRRAERRDVAIVVKGRKVAPGTIGVLIGYTDGRFGERAGLLTPAGVVWTDAANVERMHPAALDEETRRDLMIAWIDSDQSYKRSKGIRLPTPAEYAALCGLPL